MRVKKLVIVLGIAVLLMTAGCAEEAKDKKEDSQNQASEGDGGDGGGGSSGTDGSGGSTGSDGGGEADNAENATNATNVSVSWIEKLGENKTVLDSNDSLSSEAYLFEEGEKVYLKNGTYEGGVRAVKDLTLVGESQEGVVIAKNDSKYGLSADSDVELNLRNMTIKGFSTGIDLSENSRDFELENLTVKDNDVGLLADRTTGSWVVKRSTFSGNNKNVMVHFTRSDFLIRNSSLVDGSENGLYAAGSKSDWELFFTEITGNKVGVLVNGKSKHSSPVIRKSNILDNGVGIVSQIPRDHEPLETRTVYWGQIGGPKSGQTDGIVDVVNSCNDPNRVYRTRITCD
ncbi:MAG: right-handed parallel beta-helix repeat-containing protein [Halobacteria archaeon]